jgi:hypothetical protein
MRPRDLFGVGIRLMGVYFFTQAIYWGFWAVSKAETHGVIGNPNVSVAENSAYALIYLVSSLLLLFLADHIVLVCYGPQIRTKPRDTDGVLSTDGSSNTASQP